MDFLFPLLLLCGVIMAIGVVAKIAGSSSSGSRRSRNRGSNWQHHDTSLSILPAIPLNDTLQTPPVFPQQDTSQIPSVYSHNDSYTNTADDSYRPCEPSEITGGGYYETGWETSSDAGASGYDPSGGFDSGDSGCSDGGGDGE